MEILEEKNKNKGYKPILEGITDWPVYQLSKNRKEFLEEVTQKAIGRVLEIRPTAKDLYSELESTILREQNRVKRNPWRADPPDDKLFWGNLKEELARAQASDNPEAVRAILSQIVSRYIEQIAGHFKPSSYRFARRVIKFWFIRLLNGSRMRSIFGFFKNKYTLRDKIQIVGKVKMLRSLAKQGTIVMVPTHFSNIDSILIGWVIHSLGLPAFIYGAGLNLFNIKIFAYFMNSLGSYKVDRRKKSMLYMESLKMYSTIAIMKGAHSLFFPGGTRSRSGALEQNLKRGLLGSAVEAQRNLFLENKEEDKVAKIFIVPVTLNTHFVLEAPELIEEYLHSKGQEHYFPETDKYGSFQLLRFLFKFFTKGSNISVSIGPAMDVIGNYVDVEGNSLDKQLRPITTRDYFVSGGSVCVDHQRETEYTRILSQRIVEEYFTIHRIFSSHLVAFIAFEIWMRKYPMLDLFSLLRLPEEDLEIEYEEFRITFKRVRKVILKLEEKGKVSTAGHLAGKTDKAIQLGIDNVGIFHLNRPLLRNKKGNIITKDLTLLYYYHNRLTGYDFEQYI